jgi:flagellar biosynthetic protein FliR
VRGALALLLALVLAPLATPAAGEWTAGAFVIAAAGELAIGLLIGFVASLLFSGVRLAGQLIDQDMGFSMAAVLDPGSDEPAALIGQFKLVLALIVYLAINGHHVLLASVAESLRVAPVGGGISGSGATPAMVAGMAAQLFAVGLTLAIPALATLFLVTVAMAFLARTVPEMNLLTLGYPLRSLIGLAALAVSVGFFVRVFARLLADQSGVLGGVVGLLGGRP